MGIARLHGAFCDIGHSESLAHLRHHLAARLVHYGLDDLDAGDIRTRAPRRLTQEISRHIFLRSETGDTATFAGIRYGSRLGDELINWAILEPNDPTDQESDPIERDDADLHAVLEAYDLQLGDP